MCTWMLSASPKRLRAAVSRPSLMVSRTYSWSKFLDLVIWWTTSIMSKSMAILSFSFDFQWASDDQFGVDHSAPFVCGCADGDRPVIDAGDDSLGCLSFPFVVTDSDRSA